MIALLVLPLAYLVGSIPFSFLVARFFGVADVRRVGSGNVGATNVMRSAGRGPGLLAFALDAAKGALTTFVAGRLDGGSSVLPSLAAVAAVLGHMFPVWLGFRGGKGVATGAGAFAPLAPLATALALVVFALTAAVTRYVSLGSIAGATALAALAFALGGPRPVAGAATLVAALVTWKHRENLRRLVRGTESRVGSPKA